MKTAHWKIFTDATSEPKAWKVFQRFLQKFDHETGQPVLEAYHKGGHVISFQVEIPGDTWNAAVVKALALAQQVGRSWVITGDINRELDGWSAESLIAGITDLQVMMEN